MFLLPDMQVAASLQPLLKWKLLHMFEVSLKQSDDNIQVATWNLKLENVGALELV